MKDGIDGIVINLEKKSDFVLHDADLTSRELCPKDHKDEADCGKNGADYKSENSYENDRSHGSHHLVGQLKVNEDTIIAAINHFDDTHKLMEKCCWRSSGIHKNLKGEFSLAEFQVLGETLVVMKSNYLHLLFDRDHPLMLDEIYFELLKGKKRNWISFPMSLRLPRIL